VRLVLASANPHKGTEVRPLLEGAGLEVVLAGEIIPGWDVEESGDSLTENARLKARTAVAATGEAAIADDTGLFVDALGGEPGVRSSRYAGASATYADNVRKLLAALEGVPPERRTARFRTIALIARPDGEEVSFEGVLEGSILDVPRGEHGFGYDPVFLVPALGRSLAELDLEEKNRISHRAQAFGLAAAFLAGHPGWLAGSEAALAGKRSTR
jgi:XTP/dITP diphosphohydrolase